MIQAAGVSPSQAPIESILKVNLYGTAMLLEEFGQVVAEGGSGVVISSQSGYRMPALTAEQEALLATASAEDLLSLDFVRGVRDTLHAYQMSMRCNKSIVHDRPDGEYEKNNHLICPIQSIITNNVAGF